MACKTMYKGPMKVSAGLRKMPLLFDLTDPAERFMVGVMQRFYSEEPRIYRVLAMRRARVIEDGKTRRIVLQAVRFQHRRRTPLWELLIWDIDDVCVTILRQASRAAMLTSCRSLYPDAGGLIGELEDRQPQTSVRAS